MNAVVRSWRSAGGREVHHVPVFAPAGEGPHRSWLRVVNRDTKRVTVTVTGRDDAGRSAPGGVVRISLAAGASRMLSARQLESGGANVRGRLGDGAGRWRLLVSAGGAIEVMSLMQGSSGHLSNLSATPRGDDRLVIAADGPSAVQPLETIRLTVSAGLTESDYTVLVDLSGTGAFRGDDTIEIQGVTTDQDQILFASPLTQVLPENNTTRRIAVRVRHEADAELSNSLHFSVAEIIIPASLAGYPTILLEVIQKSIYASADDPLLNAEAPSIQPGLMLASARRLGLDTTFSDVQAAAIIQALTGISLADMASARGRASGIHDSNGPATSAEDAEPAGNKQRALNVPQSVNLEPWKPSLECGWTIAIQIGRDRETYDDSCFFRSTWETLKGVVNNVVAATMPAFGSAVRTEILRKLAQNAAIEGVQHVTAWFNGTVRSAKLLRLFGDSGASDGRRDFTGDASGSPVPTRRGLRRNYGGMRDLTGETRRAYPDLVTRAEREFAGRSADTRKRAAFANFVNESDRQRRDAERIAQFEDVHIGEADPLDAMRNDPGRDTVVATRCEAGYEEFPIDDDTSTCVFASLVERQCYAGSRRVSDPDLGPSGANVCLYYALDFFQANGTCRQNYAPRPVRGTGDMPMGRARVEQTRLVYAVQATGR